MAKETKKVPKKTASAAEKKEYPFDVEYISKQTKLQPASVRVTLRKNDVPKDGGKYGWTSKKEVDAIINKYFKDAA